MMPAIFAEDFFSLFRAWGVFVAKDGNCSKISEWLFKKLLYGREIKLQERLQ